MKKYVSIYKDIKEKIQSGIYLANKKLPSKRVTADNYGVSVITVEKAYAMLFEEGYIYSEEKKGYFVCPIDITNTPKAKRTFISFDYIKDDEENANDFEYSVWFKTVRKVIIEKGEKLFIKSPNKGLGILRNAIADYLYRYRKMVVEPKNIIIGSGAEQLYESAVKVLGRDKIYGIENPCYSMISSVYASLGVKPISLLMGENGIDSKWLKNNHFDVLHVTPFNSFPSGITATASKRHEYIALMKNRKGFIIEDDFASEFFKPGNPIDSLFALSDSDNVIYINTFSKSLSPSMRMGYMILPDSLLEKYDEILGEFSCSVPVMEQYVLAEFISSGSFERHLNKLRRKMQKQK